MELWEKYAIARIEISGFYEYMPIRKSNHTPGWHSAQTRRIIFQADSNKQIASFLQISTNICQRQSWEPSEPDKNSCLQTNQISRLLLLRTSHFFQSKYVTCPIYDIFLKLLWKYFQFKFRKFCLSFINKFWMLK